MEPTARQSGVQKRMLLWGGIAIAAIALWQAMAGCEPPRPRGASAYMRWTATDDSGRAWELLAYQHPRPAGQEQSEADRLKPLVGKVTVQQRGGQRVDFLLQVTTAAGHSVSSITVAGKLPTAPSLAITDASGQEVARGNFKYG